MASGFEPDNTDRLTPVLLQQRRFAFWTRGPVDLGDELAIFGFRTLVPVAASRAAITASERITLGAVLSSGTDRPTSSASS